MDVAASNWQEIAGRHPAVRLLVLLGSRATGAAHAASDWDLGVLGDGDLDLSSMRADLVARLGTDDVDLVDLRGASAVLRRDAAANGLVLAERDEGAFVEFQIEAATFWCDVEPVVREAHAEVFRAVKG